MFAATTNAATYYIDPTSGSDGNNGLATGTAWHSLEYALEGGGLAQGDTVYLMAGTHNSFKTGTDNFIMPSIGAGDSSGIVNFEPNPGDEGSVTISMPASTHATIGYLFLNNPGITLNWSNLTFYNNSSGSTVAADWFYVSKGKLIFTECTIDNNNEATKIVFNYKLASNSGAVNIVRSTITNNANYLVFFNSNTVSDTFTMRSSVVKNSTGYFFSEAADSAGQVIELVNNTFYNVGNTNQALFAMSSTMNSMKIVNNIFRYAKTSTSIFNSNAAFEEWAHDNIGDTFIFTNNIIWNSNPSSMGANEWNRIVFNHSSSYLVPIDNTNRFIDPGFVNEPSDISIAASSHILGLGDNVAVPPGGDFAGSAWIGSDIGAYTMPSATQFTYTLTDGKVAFLGDSIVGCAGSYFGTDADCVYRKFATLTGLSVVDAYVGSGAYKPAVSGGGVGLGPFMADFILENHAPKVVIISLGINNIYDTDVTGDNSPSNVTYQEVADMVYNTMQQLEDHGVIPIWIGVLSMTDGQTEPDAINAAVEVYCNANGWTCGNSLDQMRLNASWDTDYYDDNGAGGLTSNAHPDADGHSLMASYAQTLYTLAVGSTFANGGHAAKQRRISLRAIGQMLLSIGTEHSSAPSEQSSSGSLLPLVSTGALTGTGSLLEPQSNILLIITNTNESTLSPYLQKFKQRVCKRVHARFSGNEKILDRINERLMKRWGFLCE